MCTSRTVGFYKNEREKCLQIYRKINEHIAVWTKQRLEIPLRASRGSVLSTVAWCAAVPNPLKILPDKMATENSSSQDEKAALVETDSEQDARLHQQRGTVAKQSESKLTLYHWTQSLNSQKVSVFMFQHHDPADSSPYSGCIPALEQWSAICSNVQMRSPF